MQTIFYSWQSDLPNSTNRGFIADCLEKAIKELRAEGTLGVAPALDRDTQGVPGSPDIAETIFDKINNCSMFVGDVSFINGKRDDATCNCTRLTPNPNVVAEWGWASKAVGSERVVCLLNEATGAINDLPFDLPRRRVLTYSLSKDEDKTQARKVLVGKLKSAIQDIMKIPHTALELQFSDVETEEPIGQTISLAGEFIVPLETIPSFSLGGGTGVFATLANMDTNRDYLRQKATYLVYSRLMQPVRVHFKNAGGRVLHNARLDATVDVLQEEGVVLNEKHTLPELPKRQNDRLGIASKGMRNFKYAHSHPGKVDISEKAGRHRVEVSFGDVQAKAPVISDQFFVGSVKSRRITINGLVYAGEFAEPVPVSLGIDFATNRRDMTDDDLWNDLPEEENDSEECDED
jgi:hypothetical protein